MSTLKQTQTINGSTGSVEWTWKQVISEYWENNYLDTNSSRINVKTYLSRYRSNSYFGGSANFSITCNGETKSANGKSFGDTNVAVNQWILMQEENFTVTHNTDGTKRISVSSSMSNANFSPRNASASGELTLTSIPRTTDCPNLDGYIESSIPISLNPASDTFKHRLYYNYNGKTGYYPSNTGYFGKTGSLNLDSSFYDKTPISSDVGDLTLYTYTSSNSQIGTSKAKITVRCDIDKCRPIVSISAIDSNQATVNLTGNQNKFVKYESNASVSYTVTPKNGATIKSKRINNSEVSSSPVVINGISRDYIYYSFTDSRSFTTEGKLSLNMVNYVPLSLDFNLYRTTPTGTELKVKFKGNYFNSNFGNAQNTLTLQWQYKETYTNNWINGKTLVLNTDYKIVDNKYYSGTGTSMTDIVLNSDVFSYDKSYDIKFIFSDKISNFTTIKQVPKGLPVINWKDGIFNVNGTIYNNNNIVHIPTTIWTGSLQGGRGIFLNENIIKRFLDFYAQITFEDRSATLKYTIDTSINSNRVYGSGYMTGFEDGTLELIKKTYVSEAYYNKSITNIAHMRIGCFDNATGAYTDKNRNPNFVIYQIDTYD